LGTTGLIMKFLSSAKLDKIALDLYERLPLAFRHRFIYGSPFLYWKAFLQESQGWDKKRIQEYQIERLKDLLRHAKNSIPYYKKLFADYGFDPERVQTIDDIRVLPYLNKETVRDRLEEFIISSVPRKSLLMKPTSGSSGIPLTVYKTKESQKIFTAFWDDLLVRIECMPMSKIMMFWSVIELGKQKDLPFLRYGNRLIFSNKHLTDDYMAECLRLIGKFEPEFIFGFPNTLTVFSAFIKKNGYRPFRNLKAVIAHSETLYPWQRNLLKEVFGVRIFTIYVMTEFVVFAGECENSENIHMYPQYGLAEFKDFDSGHEEIVATGFTNYAMPLIRYQTGDIVIKGGELCHTCGRHHQLIDRIEGRINDFLINKEGRVIPRIMPAVKIFPHTKQYQFLQEEPGKAGLRIVRADSYSEADTLYIKSKLSEIFGPMSKTIDIEIEFVDSIPQTPAGKLNLVDQRLDIRKFLAIRS